jgi:sporulation protein YlmC with PRC-barrel domain
MTLRKIVLALTATSFLAGAALAQASVVEVDDEVMVAQLSANADTVEDWDVYTADGVKVGEVEDVLGTDAKTPTSLLVDFEDSTAYTDRDVMIALDQFKVEGDRLILIADAGTINALPEWNG